MKAGWQKLLLFGFLLILSLAALYQPGQKPTAFTLPVATPNVGAGKGKPLFRDELLPIAAPSVHAPALVELSDGRLAAAWFTGSREGARDVRIVLSVRDSLDGWSAPRPIANREQTTRDTRRNVRKLGNPVLYHQDGILHLFYVSASMGGWAGSSINYRRSLDEGEHWTPAVKLVTSPFLNISTLVRTPPLPLQDGTFALPVYHELITKHGEWLHLTAQGRVLGKTRMALPRATLQPTVVALDHQRALALLRDSGPGEGHVQVSTTSDAGQHWQAAPPLTLTNPNSSLAMLRLHDGRLLLAANPGEGRHILELWLSHDQGQSWQIMQQVDGPEPRFAPDASLLQAASQTPHDKLFPLPDASDAHPSGSGPAQTDETSYPALLQTRDGQIVLAYTWHRERIRVLTFNLAWLTKGKTP